MTTKKIYRWQLITCLTTLLALVALTPVWAQNNGKQQDGEGKYAHLIALWYQWLSPQQAVDVDGTNTFPILDTTGEYAAVDQENGIGPNNKFFFLVGTFGGNAERTVTVPAGKALFFPVVNAQTDNAVDPLPPKPFTVPQLRAFAKDFIDGISSKYAKLDGVDVEIFRAKSTTFAYTVPDENSFYAYFGLFGPQFEGRINPAVADGYWAYIPPLPPGEYTLEFGAAHPNGFSLNVTYHLTIE